MAGSQSRHLGAPQWSRSGRGVLNEDGTQLGEVGVSWRVLRSYEQREFLERWCTPSGNGGGPSRYATTLRVTSGNLAGRLIGDVTAVRDRFVALVGGAGLLV